MVCACLPAFSSTEPSAVADESKRRSSGCVLDDENILYKVMMFQDNYKDRVSLAQVCSRFWLAHKKIKNKLEYFSRFIEMSIDQECREQITPQVVIANIGFDTDLGRLEFITTHGSLAQIEASGQFKCIFNQAFLDIKIKLFEYETYWIQNREDIMRPNPHFEYEPSHFDVGRGNGVLGRYESHGIKEKRKLPENRKLKIFPANPKLYPKIEILLLGYNELVAFPCNLGSQIKRINLENNCIRHLPRSIGYITNIYDLNLNNNLLAEVPQEIGSLLNLVILRLDGNMLKTIPATLGNLRKLQQLYLSHNQLPTLPREMGQLTKLKGLYINDNPMEEVPDEILKLPDLRIGGLKTKKNCTIC